MGKKFLYSLFFLILLPITFSEAGLKKKQTASIQENLLTEYRLHPAATLQDYYKFVYQSAMGPAHWKMDFAMAKQFMDEEIQPLKPDSSEVLIQYLTADSSLIRVNLRPFLFFHGNTDSLAMAFVNTSNEFVQSPRMIETYWGELVELTNKKIIPISADSVQQYIQLKKKEGFPAMHHSKIYETLYLPAYRVIFQKYFSRNFYGSH